MICEQSQSRISSRVFSAATQRFVFVVWQTFRANGPISNSVGAIVQNLDDSTIVFDVHRVDSHWLPTQGVQEGRP